MEIRWNGSLDSLRLRRDDAILGISGGGDLKGAEAFLMSYCGKQGKLKYTQHLAKNRSVRFTEVLQLVYEWHVGIELWKSNGN